MMQTYLIPETNKNKIAEFRLQYLVARTLNGQNGRSSPLILGQAPYIECNRKNIITKSLRSLSALVALKILKAVGVWWETFRY